MTRNPFFPKPKRFDALDCALIVLGLVLAVIAVSEIGFTCISPILKSWWR